MACFFRSLVASLACLVGLEASVPRGCPVGIPLGSFQLAVFPAMGNRAARPVRAMNTIRPGQKLVYAPIAIPAEQEKKARVALILVAAGPAADKDGGLKVLEPKPAWASAEWEVPFRVAAIGLVYGPQGLDKGKVNSLVSKDRELIAQMADYAEKTAQTEALIEALVAWDRTPNATENMNAALSGFSSRYGVAMPKLDRNAPTDQQAAILFRALNPTLATYDPLAPDPSLRVQQSVGLAASVAGLFLGNTVGLAAGGTAMFLNLRTIMFPGTDFRSSLMHNTPGEGLTLCAKREPPKSRTRLAYLWAVRVPDAEAPALSIAQPANLPVGIKSAVAVRLQNASNWRHLDRAESWTLVSAAGERHPVPVAPLVDRRLLQIDLTGFQGPPGTYRLAAGWDWDTVDVSGEVRLHAVADLQRARLTAASQDRLVEGAGEVEIRLEGVDFQFLEEVAIVRSGQRNASPVQLEFALPAGLRAGPQDSFEAFVDTARFEAGLYLLLLSQADGVRHEVPVRILPPHPKLQPLRANAGDLEQRVLLQGAGLERIEQIVSDRAEIELRPTPAGQRGREAVVRLGKGLKPGDRLDLRLKVEGVQEPVAAQGLLEVLEPRPKILDAQASLPGEMGVELREGELAAGTFASFSMPVDRMKGQPVMHLQCAETALTLKKDTLRVGEQHGAARLRMAGLSTLFLSVDPGTVGQPGCTLTAMVETPGVGQSDPRILGKVVRLPRIENFTVTDETLGERAYVGILTGQELETIEKTGWDDRYGYAVESLPTPVAGESQKQSLKITVPWPSPAPRSPLYIWLRGEKRGRRTQAKY